MRGTKTRSTRTPFGSQERKERTRVTRAEEGAVGKGNGRPQKKIDAKWSNRLTFWIEWHRFFWMNSTRKHFAEPCTSWTGRCREAHVPGESYNDDVDVGIGTRAERKSSASLLRLALRSLHRWHRSHQWHCYLENTAKKTSNLSRRILRRVSRFTWSSELPPGTRGMYVFTRFLAWRVASARNYVNASIPKDHKRKFQIVNLFDLN